MFLIGLCSLPVEILCEIQLYALSPALVLTSKHLRRVFRGTPTSFRAAYILARIGAETPDNSRVLTKALRYPLCTTNVFDAICCRMKTTCLLTPAVELPKRLFRTLGSERASERVVWGERTHPLPFLKHLYEYVIPLPPAYRDPCNDHATRTLPLNTDSHDGYALMKAVQAGFIPLVRFLLDHGAHPGLKDALAVRLAIRRKELSLVRMLIERASPNPNSSAKRRRMTDRIEVSPEVLKAAVKYDARDIVEYLTGKGCVPDMQTLQIMMR